MRCACARSPSASGKNSPMPSDAQPKPLYPAAPAGAPQPAAPPARGLPRTVAILGRVAVVLVAGAIVFLFATQWDRWVGLSARQVTDDAYIRGDITPLSAKVEGYVRHVAVDDFDRVKQGDLLVEIDDADYRAKVAQAEADLLGAEAAIENLKSRKAT